MLMLSADYIMAASRTRPPDFIVKRTKVDGSGGEYLRRWWVIPRNDSFNIYLHQFVDDDDDRALHDHPWPSASLILQSGYIEHLPGGITQLRVPGELIYREPEVSHRISLHRDTQGNPLPAWSLFMTGARIRDWGFHCPQGWVHWEKFTAVNDRGAVGEGCGA